MKHETIDMCFACGKSNPIGLHLNFKKIGDKVVAKFIPKIQFQGYIGIMHGGVISTILDEAMAKFLALNHIEAVTGKLEIRFRHPVPIGKTIMIEAKEVVKKRILHKLKAMIYLDDGTLAAEACSSFMEIAPDGTLTK